MYKDLCQSLVKGQSSNCSFLCIRSIVTITCVLFNQPFFFTIVVAGADEDQTRKIISLR